MMDFLTSLNFWLWVAAALLAAMYVFAGFMKSTKPIAELAPMMGWAPQFPVALVRFIGIAELLGGIGLILPLATGILPWLTPLAAICFVVLQVLAIGLHVQRREFSVLGLNVVLLAAAVFVAWGRWHLFGG